jgi:hypothetical protein
MGRQGAAAAAGFESGGDRAAPHGLSNRQPLLDDEEAERAAAFKVARSCQKDHLGRGWVDTGQHFTISRGGLILEGRRGTYDAARAGKVVWGAHATLAKYNRSYFGIETEGTYHLAFDMPDAQWQALVELCAWLAAWGGIDPKNIIGHKEIKATACPGLLSDRLPELRQLVLARVEELEAV